MNLTPQGDLTNKLEEIRRAGEEREAKRRAERLKLTYADLGKTPISIEAVALLPEADARKALGVGIQLSNKDLAVIFYDPTTEDAKKATSYLEGKGYKIKSFVVSLSAINQALEFYKFISKGKYGL